MSPHDLSSSHLPSLSLRSLALARFPLSRCAMTRGDLAGGETARGLTAPCHTCGGNLEELWSTSKSAGSIFVKLYFERRLRAPCQQMD